MHLKRYRGSTVREALAAARADLGPTALVLSTRLVPAHGMSGWFGQRVVEVTAAAERAMSESRSSAAAPASAPEAPEALAVEPKVTATAADAVVARLVASGLDRVLAQEVAGRVPRRQRRAPNGRDLAHALGERLQWLAAEDEAFAPVEVFVGPPGAGKTTTIAKIAAQQRARRRAVPGLVAADGFRVGAVEQLRLYADIIGASFSIARTLPDVERAVAESQAPVLVDTAGRSPRDREALDLFGIVGGWPQARTHLVVPATTSPDGLQRVLDAYAAANPTRVVFTKLDEADGLAPLVRVLRDRDLVVSYLTAGQRVPEDLARATPARLAACVLGEDAAAGDPS